MCYTTGMCISCTVHPMNAAALKGLVEVKHPAQCVPPKPAVTRCRQYLAAVAPHTGVGSSTAVTKTHTAPSNWSWRLVHSATRSYARALAQVTSSKQACTSPASNCPTVAQFTLHRLHCSFLLQRVQAMDPFCDDKLHCCFAWGRANFVRKLDGRRANRAGGYKRRSGCFL